MLQNIINLILETVSEWWYTGIFVMMTIESSFFPFPSEVAMIPAWYLSSTWDMNFSIALLVWSLWAITWATFNYVLARYLWAKIIKSIIHKYGKYIFLKESHYEASERYFKSHWSITTFLARFIPAVRQLISLPAWVFRMNYWKFILYTWLWATIWNLILMIIWYLAGENKELIKEYSSLALIWAIIFIILVWIIYHLVNKKFTKK